ncbi:CheY-like receiver domain-containing protein (modular protein) [Agrobacterium tumefaciens str. Kerr 14]|uniref:CheY-like receiver domain-containing protein (Modular protein) n=1 Tax=Agrobacterium tumefaciens str. Kerr 14 TaxID=1183424 RepID=A0A1S7SEW6_AGRTU|nr:hypothetical protein [Agrobacterium tumefaciens]CUX68078.1 CheY-like receiver domain-containing protein (modular protein) [Agrobacterium tumefaciens str. Kerr 14]
MGSSRLPECVMQPDELRLVQIIFDRIAAQSWFSRKIADREQFALYILRMYRRGLVVPEKLEAVCTLAAQKYYSGSASDLKGRRILVVEDDYFAAQEMAANVRAVGAVVVGPISNLSDAMDVAGQDRDLDGALLDVNLGGDMVYPVAGFLKMHCIPFAFVSGYDERVLPPAFRNTPLFLKPTDWRSIASAVPHR